MSFIYAKGKNGRISGKQIKDRSRRQFISCTLSLPLHKIKFCELGKIVIW